MAGIDLLLQDSNLSVSVALPSAAATAVTSLVDLANGPKGQFDAQRVEFSLSTPLLTGTQLIGSSNIAYSVFSTDVATTNTASAVLRQSLTQYGVAASGTAATSIVFRVPLSINRYLFALATASASTAATASSVSLVALF